MPCVSANGAPIENGKELLTAVKSGFITPEDVARETRLPMWAVRSGLRELVLAGFASQTDEIFGITERGVEELGKN
jgi:hypothetical protein